MKRPTIPTASPRCPYAPVFFALIFLTTVGQNGLSQDICDQCVYYEVIHKSRIEGHPTFGTWEQVRRECLLDNMRTLKVTADGSRSSRIEFSVYEEGVCNYENINPQVQFIDEDFNPVASPTPEEHGIIDVIDMTETSLTIEYTHPTDQPASGETYRIVRMELKDYNVDFGDTLTVGYLELWVHRPPLLGVHGLWANNTSFNAMDLELVNSQAYYLFDAADYRSTNASNFVVNTDVVPQSIDELMQQVRDAEFSSGKVNLVVHSMGGILSRNYLQNAYRDDVYRLITCNTPHSGAQSANWLLDPNWTPRNDSVCAILGGLGMPCYEGAVNDLQVGSGPINLLNAGSHPSEVGVHALVTVKDPPQVPAMVTGLVNRSIFLSLLIGITNSCSMQILDSLYMGDEHDLVVAKASQYGGLSGNTTSYIQDQMHVGSVSNDEVITKVQELIDEPFSSNKFTFTGYPAPALSYTSNIPCIPALDESEIEAVRSPGSIEFVGSQPGDLDAVAGDSLGIAVSGPGADTIVLVFEVDVDNLWVQKLPGPYAEFDFVIPEEIDSTAGISAFGLTSDGEITGICNDTLHINQPYQLLGISVFPISICASTSDTAALQIIGHYDDGMDRPLNGNADLEYHFTTFSAVPTAESNIVLTEPKDDTLIIAYQGITSDTITITHIFNATGPFYWTGEDGSWMDADKWDLGCIPGRNSIVYIPTGLCTIPPFAQIEITTLNLGAATLINNGTLAMANSTSVALNVNKGTFMNNGTLNISTITNSAMQLQGQAPSDSAFFVNRGLVSFDSCLATYGIYIGSHSFFINDTNGVYEHRQCGQFQSIETTSSVTPKFVNKGHLTIINSGEPGGFGRFLNSGYFGIEHTVPGTYDGFQGSWFHNTASGIVNMENVKPAGFYMPFSGDSLKNDGMITITGSSDQGTNVHYLLNNGSLRLSEIPNEALYMEGNDFTTNNTENGSIEISHSDVGIYVRNTNSTFLNHGSLFVDSTDSEGIAVRFNGTFINESDGSIEVDHTGSHGINVLDNTNTSFQNHGVIHLSRTTDNGINITGNALFENGLSGRINCRDIIGSGIATSGNFLAGNTFFSNKGRIEISKPVGTWGIDNTKKFTNDTCGVIHTESAIRNASASFINNGVLHLKDTVPNSISTSQKILNNGLIEDLNGQLDIAGQINNNGVAAAPRTYSGCSDSTITDFFELGSFNGWEVSDGYTNELLSVVAGSLDSPANTFTPAASGVTSALWHFEAINTAAGCIDTIRVRATAICPVNCFGDPFYWTGCVDQNWADPGNWNKASVPTTLDTVWINGSPAGGIFPELNMPTTLKGILLQPHAKLTLKPGGDLTIEN